MPAYDETLRRITLQADSSIALYTGPPGIPGSTSPNYGFQFRFVKITGDHTVGLCTAAADPIVGVLQNKPQRVGEAATVALGGVSLVNVAAALTFGQQVAANATGQGILWTTGTVAGLVVRGAGGVTGALAPVLLRLGS
jgi:hypothetical protein